MSRYAKDDKDIVTTLLNVCQGIGMVASFSTSIFAHNLMTSLYIALGLLVLGFLGLITVASEATLRNSEGLEVTGIGQWEVNEDGDCDV